MTTKRSVTETSNELTTGLDLSSPMEMGRLFRQTDSQIFSGYLGYAGMTDDCIVRTLCDLARRCARTLKSPRGCVVMSGAGTSGRLSMFVARGCNRVLSDVSPNDSAKFRYLMAGGNAALIQAFEGAEDDAALGLKELREITAGADDVFYVGITCGMSAPYVGGQLEGVVNGTVPGHAVLMAFNPTELARRLKVDGWDKTFADVVDLLKKSDNATILNPILGPEPVTGSTRMKSGTGTRILLEAMFRGEITEDGLYAAVSKVLLSYRDAIADFYYCPEKIGRLIELGGNALRLGGRILYLGPAGVNAAGQADASVSDGGIIALVDASECPPTYGASFDDVRGFIWGGWKAMFPYGGEDFSHLGVHYRISLDNFVADMLPTLSANDLCVFLGEFAERDTLLHQVRQKSASTVLVQWGDCPHSSETADLSMELSARETALCGGGLIEIQLKLLANALTTVAHVLKGKVYGNRMIDLRISNNKLFHRTVGIVTDLMKVDEASATEAVLHSIFETDTLTDDLRATPIVELIERAKSVDKVVPKALLIASGKFDYQGACKALAENPMVRTVLASVSQ